MAISCKIENGAILIWQLGAASLENKMVDVHEVESCMQRYHIYGDNWTPNVGDLLYCEQKSGNPTREAAASSNENCKRSRYSNRTVRDSNRAVLYLAVTP